MLKTGCFDKVPVVALPPSLEAKLSRMGTLVEEGASGLSLATNILRPTLDVDAN